MKKFYIFFFYLIIATLAEESPNFVIFLSRHGARSPVNEKFENNWPEISHLSLTPRGKHQLFNKGKIFSDKYADLLFSKPFEGNILAIANKNCQRCYESGKSFFHGIHAYRVSPQERADLDLQDEESYMKFLSSNYDSKNDLEIDSIIRYADQSQMKIFNSEKTLICPNIYSYDEANIIDEIVNTAWKTKFRPFLKHINQYTAINHPEVLTEFLDHVVCNIFDGRDLPYSIQLTPEFELNSTFVLDWLLTHAWYGDETQRQLKAFGIANSLVEFLNNFREGRLKKEFVLLFGHDFNLLSLLSPLGIVTDNCLMENYESILSTGRKINNNCEFPAFGSNIRIELYNHTHDPYVKFYYNDNLIKLCEASEKCRLDSFIHRLQKLYGEISVESYEKSCGIKNEFGENIDRTYLRGNNLMIVLSTSIIFMILVKLLQSKCKKIVYAKLE